jgi:outer membrane lipoprotein SlyB
MLRLGTLAAFCALALPSLAFADDSGAVTGGAGGAVAGAVVGGPVGAVVGGAAGAIVGGAASGPNRTVVVEPRPAVPCHTRTTETTDNTGYSSTTQTTNCPD